MNEELLNYAGCDALFDTMHAVYIGYMMPVYRILQNQHKSNEELKWSSWENAFTRLHKAIR